VIGVGSVVFVVERPSGLVTFLFTDIEGSTRRWESDPDEMRAALAAHDEVLRSAIDAGDLACELITIARAQLTPTPLAITQPP
jgi:class 3 adenylate cyclase